MLLSRWIDFVILGELRGLERACVLLVWQI